MTATTVPARDPVRMAGAYVGSYDKTPYTDRVSDFLNRPGDDM